MTYKAPNLCVKRHCFFGADGGFSTGFYKGLNVNTKSDDDQEKVRANLQKAAEEFGLGLKNLHLLNQGVSSHVEYVEKPTQDEMTADGAVTDKREIILCIRTADCAPVLLADYEHGVIGAAHAGWRGALAGVIENTVDLMLQKGAKEDCIAAAVGPCIAQKSYEVDEGFYDAFARPEYFVKGQRDGHYLFDLEKFCVDRLKTCGVKNISASGIDTYAEEDKYYSFRRFTHQGLVKKPKCFPTELSAVVL